jgi:hypothetical protein
MERPVLRLENAVLIIVLTVFAVITFVILIPVKDVIVILILVPALAIMSVVLPRTRIMSVLKVQPQMMVVNLIIAVVLVMLVALRPQEMAAALFVVNVQMAISPANIIRLTLTTLARPVALSVMAVVDLRLEPVHHLKLPPVMLAPTAVVELITNATAEAVSVAQQKRAVQPVAVVVQLILIVMLITTVTLLRRGLKRVG